MPWVLARTGFDERAKEKAPSHGVTKWSGWSPANGLLNLPFGTSAVMQLKTIGLVVLCLCI